MSGAEQLAVVGSCLALATSIVAPALIVGRYLGGILTTQASHAAAISKLGAEGEQQARRVEGLGRELSHLQGAFGARSSSAP